ncbi:hypothetical protein F5Y14DRAFT_440065 [Nemania sp. NC0429]|nr:hypothetical protein F5Y14DRAFT_440065 [Nemania sp. NC0429]
MGITHTHPRGARQTARLRQIVVISVICLAVYCFLLVPDKSLDGSRSTSPEAYPSPPNQRQRPQGQGGGREEEEEEEPLPPELLNNRFLTEEQCRATFPGLLDQVDDEVAKGPFKLQRPGSTLGPLIARIRDGQLYILSAARKVDLSQDMLAHRAATLHQIANALLTWPRPFSSPSSSPSSHIPNTIIAFNHHDDPLPSTFSYSRPADPALQTTPSGAAKRFFPVPHFSFYSWPLPFIGSLPRAARAIADLEAALPFRDKVPRAVWRGTTWFNNPRAGRLRQNLVRAFGPASRVPRPWADVAALDWDGGAAPPTGVGVMAGAGERNATNALPIEAFCRYKYILHTEGVTYSGRFQFHNLCASVVLTPPVAWHQHLTHLLRPVFSYTLDPDAPDLPPPSSSSSSSSSPSRLSFRSLLSSLSSTSLTNPRHDPPSPRSDKTNTKHTSKAKGLPRTPIDLGPHENPPALTPYPAPWVRSAWPTEHDATSPSSTANIVFVAPDWSDLEATVAWLEARPRAAEAIARRQRALFAGRGYLSPAAEACYWRGLVKGWAAVARIADEDHAAFAELGDGVPWEEFSLKEIHK